MIKKQQQGAALITALMMLIIMTLFALSSVEDTTIDLKIVSNMQSQQLVETDVQSSIEDVISLAATFDSPAADTRTATNGVTVNIAAPVCLNSVSSTVDSDEGTDLVDSTTGDDVSITVGSAVDPAYDNAWEIVATATDTLTGANVTIHQGVLFKNQDAECL